MKQIYDYQLHKTQLRPIIENNDTIYELMAFDINCSISISLWIFLQQEIFYTCLK